MSPLIPLIRMAGHTQPEEAQWNLRSIISSLFVSLAMSPALAAPSYLGVWGNQDHVDNGQMIPACSPRNLWSFEENLITTDFDSDFEIQSSTDLGGGDYLLRILYLSDTPAEPVDLELRVRGEEMTFVWRHKGEDELEMNRRCPDWR